MMRNTTTSLGSFLIADRLCLEPFLASLEYLIKNFCLYRPQIFFKCSLNDLVHPPDRLPQFREEMILYAVISS